jgi:hypothetical protein
MHGQTLQVLRLDQPHKFRLQVQAAHHDRPAQQDQVGW